MPSSTSLRRPPSDLTVLPPAPIEDQDPTERTSLLHQHHHLRNGLSDDHQHDEVTQATSPPGRPLPKAQIFLLCYARMLEPIAFFSIFPYIAQMVARNGDLPPADVGFYSGLIESLFSATQMVVLILWGRMADRLGRKPVLLYSLLGTAVGPCMFGMATSIWQMILFRCIAGVFSGSGLIIRTMVSEHSTAETQARAFSWFAFGGNLGIFLGPIIGGALADPATQYPQIFAGIRFFEQYPYSLAGFAVGTFSLTGFVTSALFLKETLPKDTYNDGTTREAPQRLSTWELLKAPGVGVVLWIYGHVMLLAFTFTAIIPVALYTPVELGGFGFGPSMISAYMAVQGASQALWLLLVFPWLQRRIGTRGVMKLCGAAYPVFFSLYVVLNTLLRMGTEEATAWFWAVGVTGTVVGPGVSMSFTGAQLALNDVSPNPYVLGTLNAVALTMSSGIRSVAPGVSTAVYAWGVRDQILWGHLAWVVLVGLAGWYAVGTRWLPEGRMARREEESDDEEEGEEEGDDDYY